MDRTSPAPLSFGGSPHALRCVCAERAPLCDARTAASHSSTPWLCTRPAGHDGEHVACGSTPDTFAAMPELHCFARWPQEVRAEARPCPRCHGEGEVYRPDTYGGDDPSLMDEEE